jgi:DNA invertase Pin-like site-specific DNA recombinase
VEGALVGYYRVSTEGQAEHGLSLDAQRDMVGAYAEERGMPLINGFTEVESAYRPSRMSLDKRPELRAALARCKRLKATLAIAALDRLARNVVFIASLIETRVRFVALDIPDATPFMLHIYAAVAEEESRQKGEVTKAAIALSRAQGTVWGRNFVEQARARRCRFDRLRGVIDEIRAAGITGSTLVGKELNRRGVPCEAGRAWSSCSARSLLQHLGYYDVEPNAWFEHRRRQAEARLAAVAEVAREVWSPRTPWSLRAADLLNARRIRTGQGLEWDRGRVETALKFARTAGLWSPPARLQKP